MMKSGNLGYVNKWVTYDTKDTAAAKFLFRSFIEELIGSKISHNNEITFRVDDHLLMRLTPSANGAVYDYELEFGSDTISNEDLHNRPMKYFVDILKHNFPEREDLINDMIFDML